MSKRILSLVLSLSLLIAVTVGGWTMPASAAGETETITNYAQYNLINMNDTTGPSHNAIYFGHNDGFNFDNDEGTWKLTRQNAWQCFKVNPDANLSEESITVTFEYKLPVLDSEASPENTRLRFTFREYDANFEALTDNNAKVSYAEGGSKYIMRAQGVDWSVNGSGDNLERGQWAVYSFVVTGDVAKNIANGGYVHTTFWRGKDENGPAEDVIYLRNITLCSTKDLIDTDADEYVNFSIKHPLYPDKYGDSKFIATNNMTWALGEGNGTLTNDGMSMATTGGDMVYFRPTKSLHEKDVAVRCVFKEETGYAAVQYNVPEDPNKPGHTDEQYKRVDGNFSNHELWFDLSDADFRSAQNNQASFRVCFPGLTLQRVEVYVLKNNSGYTATLKEDISLNFQVGSPLFTQNAANTNVAVTVNGNTTTTTLNEYTTDGKQYVVPVPVAAKNMGDKITVTVKNTVNNVDMSFTKSVKEYAESILASSDSKDIAAQSLVKAMLNYGAAAQTYFGYNTDALVNAGLAEADKVLPSDIDLATYNEHNKSQSVGDVTFIGANLSLKSKTILRLYFTADETFTASVNGQNLTVMKEEVTGRSYVEVNNITPDKLAEDIVVSVTSGTVTGDVTYNVMSYCYNVLKLDESKYADLQNAICALCLYNTAAADYVDNWK